MRNDVPEILLRKHIFTSHDSSVLLEEEMRLDAPYYSDSFMKARGILERAKERYQTKPLLDFCDDIFRLGQFKRVWSDKAHGFPYMAASDLFSVKYLREQEAPSRAFVARNRHGKVASIKSALKERSPMRAKEGEARFFVEKGWILVSCSGSVGRLTLVTKSLCGYFFSHDFIRIVPKQGTWTGYLYAYLSSWVGQAFLKHDIHGGWVKHIEPEQIQSVPIVDLPQDEQKEIHDNVMRAYDCREDFLMIEAAEVDRLDSLFNKL